MAINYRNLARTHQKKAKEGLYSNDDLRLKYAALELRMSMEALTYDRALAYKDEFPPEEYETWQPRKVMAVLLDIDPMADSGGSIAVGVQDQIGAPATKMTELGTEEILSMKVLKNHYDALGSYLHIQSIKQSKKGSLNYEKIRKRCEEIAGFIETVLSSPVFNVTLGSFSSTTCMECGKTIRKRIPVGQTEIEARCYECNAEYTLSFEENDKVKWTPHQHEIECANENCHEKIIVWRHEFAVGKYWKCKACKGQNTFVFSIQYKETPN